MDCNGCKTRGTKACRFCPKNATPRAMSDMHLEFYESMYEQPNVMVDRYKTSKSIRSVIKALDPDTLEPIICELYFRRTRQKDIAEMLGLKKYQVCLIVQSIVGKINFMARFKELCRRDKKLMEAFMKTEED